MAITDYATLVDAVQVWCARSDSTFSNQIPQFISLAEERIFHGVGGPQDPLFSEAVRTDEMLTDTTIALTSGTGTLASDCLAVRRLDRTADRVGLDPLSPDELARRVAFADTGNPRWYTVEGRTLKTAPSGYTGNLNILYYARPTGISSGNTTNAVLTARPMLYLYATLIEAFMWMNAGQQSQNWLAMYRATASGVNRTATAIEHGGGKRRAQPRRVFG